MEKTIKLYEYEMNNLLDKGYIMWNCKQIIKLEKGFILNGEFVNVKIDVEHKEKIEKLEKELLSKYANKIKECLDVIARNRSLVKQEIFDIDAPMTCILRKEYANNNIKVGGAYGWSFYDVVRYDEYMTKPSLSVHHYWCGARMNTDGESIWYNQGSSGVCDTRKSLEENKERFLNEFMSSFDTFYKVVMMFK